MEKSKIFFKKLIKFKPHFTVFAEKIEKTPNIQTRFYDFYFLNSKLYVILLKLIHNILWQSIVLKH